ncbi:transporter substrate-binding domain-containing protein [Rheinheimera aquimaris]|uniref:transporter substrate-binding domain-containing protein n=1 Tax=Rheinheimera aquimaris TaxID=412437 RepID=UPI001E3B814E|nr:transporter substrate-binding domain-containing protein [Rheinheimera aquimaris]MCD1598405.1 transporter substrate-binding domain-containing protein [Rheinheimera aquimaris]
MNSRWPRLGFIICLFLAASAALASSEQKLIFRSALDTPAAQYSQALLSEAYKAMGIPVEFITVPLGRSLIESNRGNLSGELARVLEATQSYPNLRAVPYVLFDTDVNLYVNQTKCAGCSLSTVNSVVYIRGAVILENMLQALPSDIKLIQAADTAAARQLYEQQKVDAALFVAYSLPEQPQGFDSMMQTLKTVPDYHMLHKRYQPLLQALAKTLFKLEADGTAARLRQQFGVASPKHQLQSHLSQPVAEFH